MSVAALLAMDQPTRLKALQAERMVFTTHKSEWVMALDAYESEGGFLNGDYLWKFPSELPVDFQARKQHARYHNFVESLVDLYVRHLFSQAKPPQTTSEDLKAWWTDVDGAGTTREQLMRQALAYSLVTGHVGVFVDRSPDPPAGASKADQRGQTMARLFPATSVPDWRFLESGELDAVKLLEPAPEGGLETPPQRMPVYRWLVWDRTGWARFAADASVINTSVDGAGSPPLGIVPLHVLRTKPLLRDRMLGRALVQTSLVDALYNRNSEEDHLLRDQAFSQLVAELDKDAPPDAVQATQDTIQANYGVKRVIVLRGTMHYVTAEMTAPTELRTNANFLIREMFRNAHVPYDKDSRTVESAQSLALKRDELGQMLQGLAASLTQLEQRIAYYWFVWNTPGNLDAAEQAFEAAQVETSYPREFFLDDLLTDLQAWGEGLSMVQSETFGKLLQKDVVGRIKPDLAPATRQTIDDEIDSAPPQQTPPAAPPGQFAARMASRVQLFDQPPSQANGGEPAIGGVV
jgi:hypothetical protein